VRKKVIAVIRYEGGKPRLLKASLVLAVLVAALALLVGVASAQEGGQDVPRAQPQASQEKIPNSYIVVFEEEEVRDPAALANEHARAYGLRLRFRYQHAIEGYAAVFPNDRALQRVRSDPRVDYVEQDQVARAVVRQTLPWGIKKIGANLSSTRAGDGTGAVSNVKAYVLDTGIYEHGDLNVVDHVNFVDDQNTDCNGHGTHVAGTLAAEDNARAVVGVAPGAPLIDVRVLGCDGTGSWSGIIAGVDWVTANAVKPAVANMSLSGGASQAVDDAVLKSANSGVFYSVAAGNAVPPNTVGNDACSYSPARAGANTDNGIVTTAATDSKDREASFSNYGSCVDIWAPGVNILSTKMGGGTTTFSGTSMAAPHVGGGGALYLSTHASANPSAVESSLKASATTTANKSKDGQTIKREYVGGF
jgi:subtilisin family serine protease